MCRKESITNVSSGFSLIFSTVRTRRSWGSLSTLSSMHTGGRERPFPSHAVPLVSSVGEKNAHYILTQQKTFEARFSSNCPIIILTSLSCKWHKNILIGQCLGQHIIAVYP